ncbi:MAG: hypothetical protein A7315_12480 [Candidatus Altiarchaeales archaeon WOR_SM1_79]|nr:MAG: hypothetical protein A7315_12480 [Candidatus Altiarchaeales archaeon WOR_SM1_79]
MGKSKCYRYRVTVILVIILIVMSILSIPIDITYPVEGGKYGNMVPTIHELQLLDKINENRTDNSAGNLKLNASLCWVARAHSQDMIDYDFFDHNSSIKGQFNGATFSERVGAYTEYENSYIGECIALKNWGIDVESVMTSWKNSPEHWAIIIDPNFNEIGIGLLEGEWGGTPDAGLHTAVFGGDNIAVDLSVSDLDMVFDPPSPSEGEVVNISARIHNLKLTDAFPVMVKFFDGDPNSGGMQIGTEQQIPHILIHGESASVNVLWNTTWEAGSHNIYVVVDEDNVITETNEGNNIAFKSLVVNVTNPLIHLSKGWNLVSFPYIMSNTSLEYVLGSIKGEYDAVQFFNSSDALDPWKHYYISKSSHMNHLYNLDNKKGFWVHITNPEDTIFLYNGTQPTSNQTIQFHPGWNMVGYPSLTNHNRTVGLNNITFGTEVDAVQWYDAATKTWHDMGPDDNFVPGSGYWVHANVECEWEVPL